MLRIVTFHKIRNFDLGGTWNTPDQMASFFSYIVDNKIDVIKLSDLASEPFKYLNDEALHLLITFDDGDEGIYKYLLPIMQEFSLPACVFLISKYIGKNQSWDIFGNSRHLNWDEIRALKDQGFEFGSHSVSHCDLTRMKDEGLRFELEESRRIIEKRVGSCCAITYPYDRVDKRVMDMAKKVGYKVGFGNKDFAPLSIKRERIFRTDNLSSFKIKVSRYDSLLLRWERFKSRVINVFSVAAIRR